MHATATRQRAVVVGGGLAGIAAALNLADRGADVVLLEAEASLGGRTGSFAHGDYTFDHGQPVFLRCCTAYRALLDRIGAADQIVLQPSRDLAVLSPGASPAMLRAAPLPPPFHLAPSLTLYHHLTLADRARIEHAARAFRALDPSDPALDHRRCDEWLADHHQSRAAIELFWNVAARPLQNLPMSEVSLAVAAKVFRTTLLDDVTGGDIGWTTAPLSEVHGTAAVRALEASGVDVRLRSRVGGIVAADGAVEGVTIVGPARPRGGGELVAADVVILAVPPFTAARLLRPHVRVPDPNEMLALPTSPIVNVHLVLDRRVTDFPIAAAVRSPVQLVFDRSDAAGVGVGQQCIVSSIGAAVEEVERPSARLVAEQVAALRALLPAMRHASVVDAVVTRRRAATLASAPGDAALRPTTNTVIGGLFLAGAWTATGWPDSMESAVRSGHTAAAAATSPNDAGLVGPPTPGAATLPA